jgi:hypothetical protein
LPQVTGELLDVLPRVLPLHFVKTANDGGMKRSPDSRGSVERDIAGLILRANAINVDIKQGNHTGMQ